MEPLLIRDVLTAVDGDASADVPERITGVSTDTRTCAAGMI